ncbi:hypothetical protein NGY2020029_32390 [Vibrio cholerae]|nr:glycosyltransferase family 4 protein [Vibrio cholerae]
MIAHFVYNFFSYSGAAFQAHSLCKEFKSSKHVLFNVGNSRSLSIVNCDGILVFDLPVSYIKRLLYITILFYMLGIKAVHSHGWILSGILPAIIFKKKIILKTTMFGDDDLLSISKRNRLYKLIVRHVSSVISISTVIKKNNDEYIYRNNLSCSSKLIFNGVNSESSLNYKINNKDENVFCTVGVISKRKGTLRAIEYFIENYASTNELAKLYVVGPTPEEMRYHEADIDYFYQCKAWANRYPEKVIITGKMDKKALQDIYMQSIGLIFFSEKEGMPNVVLEAMYHNCVPILTSIEGVSYDIVNNKEDGFILSDSLCEKINLLAIKNISNRYLPHKKINQKFLLKKIALLHNENYRELGV